MKRRVILICAVAGIGLTLGFLVIKLVVRMNLFDKFATDDKSCGYAWKNYGECDKGYYCKSNDQIQDVPGTCVKVVAGQSYIVSQTASIDYLDQGLTVAIDNSRPFPDAIEWQVTTEKGGKTTRMDFRLKGLESRVVYAFGYKLRFDGLDDGVDRTRMKVTLL